MKLKSLDIRMICENYFIIVKLKNELYYGYDYWTI